MQVRNQGAGVSAAREDSTWAWGDVDQNGVANFADVLLIAQVFQGNYANASHEAADIDLCTPNATVNFGDIQMGVKAFQGQSYTESSNCPMPCE